MDYALAIITFVVGALVALCLGSALYIINASINDLLFRQRIICHGWVYSISNRREPDHPNGGVDRDIYVLFVRHV